MEIPIHGNGEAGQLPEDDGLEQDLQQVMVSGPNLNETSIVSGGYGGSGDGLIPTGSGRHPSHSASPSGPGDEVARGIAGEKFDIVKKWGINTYKCTKQLLSERFGRGSRTVDLELELQIELLRETKRKYESVLQLGRALTAHLYSLLQTQHALGDAFADLSQKSPELQVPQPKQRGWGYWALVLPGRHPSASLPPSLLQPPGRTPLGCAQSCPQHHSPMEAA